jgi:hypothetical protein
VNGGKVNTQEVEIILGVPIKTNNFKWNTFFLKPFSYKDLPQEGGDFSI